MVGGLDDSRYHFADLCCCISGVFGTGIGILASLYPVELTGKRDYYQRLVKMWRLLDFERNDIVRQSEDRADHLSDAESPIPMIISSFPFTAWQTVR